MTVELSGPGLFSLARLGFDMVRLLQLPPPSYLLCSAGSLKPSGEDFKWLQGMRTTLLYLWSGPWCILRRPS